MRPLIRKAARMLTDCMDVKAGLVRMDEERMEYKLLDAILSDDMAHAALKMGVRNPVTPEELAKKLRWSTEKTQAILDEMAQLGIVEYNRHNDDRHKQYVLPIFVVGSAENIMLNKELVRKLGSLAPRFFYEMSLEPLKLISGMVPPGGAGLGFHVIPVERAIPKESQAVDIERLSYWLKKYEGHYAIQDCVCRKTMIALGQGCGELPEGSCISLGDYSDYLVETGKANRASYEEIIAVLWEGETDMAAAKDRLRHMIADLKRTLSSVGMEHILVRRSGQLAILRDRVACDFYRMLDGDMDIVNTFDGEYMSRYSWAELTTGRLVFRKNK